MGGVRGRRLRTVPAIAAALVVVCAIAVSGCGGDDEETQKISLVLTETSGGQVSFRGAPASADPGLVEITLRNTGTREHEAQLFRVEGEHTPREVVDGISQSVQGRASPAWLFAGGGVGPTPKGRSQTITQALLPGTYYVGDIAGTDEPPDPADVPVIEVTGEESDAELPEADATVTAREYSFAAEGLSAGETEIRFDNDGAQPHHLIAARLREGSTIDDARNAILNNRGPNPFTDEEGGETTVVEGGEGQVVTFDLKPGNYALLCFVADREGGPPHAVKGMISPATVD